MTRDDLQILALGLDGHVIVRPVLDTFQFHIGGNAFATVNWPAEGWAAIKLDPRDQSWAMSLCPALSSEPGRRRKAGIVLARLTSLEADVAAELLAAAWRHGRRRLAPAARRSAFAPQAVAKAA